MEITRREGLRLLAVLGGLVALPGALTGCADGSDPGRARPGRSGSGELELVSSDVRRATGSAQALPEAAASVSTLGAGLFEALRGQTGNLVLSPYSVAVALAMSLNGAAGATAAELQEVLDVNELDGFNAGLNALTQYVEGLAGRVERSDGTSEDLVLAAANQLFGQRDTTWSAPFLDTLARDYGAGMRLVDYVADPEGARSLINGWTAEQTRDRIPEIVPEGVLDALTRLVLVNALYLKAPWDVAFEPAQTSLHAFRTQDGRSIEVPTMMRGLDSAGHASGSGWEAVRIPYAGRQLAMTVLLPAVDGLEELSAAVGAGGLGAMLAAIEPDPVQLWLPTWRFRSQVGLTEALRGLGMHAAFDPARADFSAMTSEERLHVSAVLHEGFIAVDETGTEAAAATAEVMAGTSMPVYRQVVVDRPFLFVIHDIAHGTPLFLGRVVDPTA